MQWVVFLQCQFVSIDYKEWLTDDADVYTAAAFHLAQICLWELDFSGRKDVWFFLSFVLSRVHVNHEYI